MGNNEEIKNRRKQLVFYPSLYDDLERLQTILVDESGKPLYKSFNDLMDHIGREFVEKHRSKLDAHTEFLKSIKINENCNRD